MRRVTSASLDKVDTLDDLADALLGARSNERSTGAMRDYNGPRGEAFKQAFGLRDDDRRKPDMYLIHLVNSTLESMLSFRSPVAGYMEAPRELVELAERFMPEIQHANDELDRALRKILRASLEELVEPGRTTVTARDLIDHGFDPAPEAPDPYEDC